METLAPTPIFNSPTTRERLKAFKPALIFFDVDGTLLNTHGHYSPQLKRQLERLEAKGVKLSIASGRPAIAAQFLFDDLPLTDAGLFCTGAELYDPKQQQHLTLHLLDSEQLADLYQSICSLDLYCEFYTPDFYTAKALDYDITHIHSQHLRVNPRVISGEEVLKQSYPVTKLLLGAHEKTQGDQLKSLADIFSSVEFAFAHFLARPEWLFASVVSSSANKQQGFADILAYHQVSPDQVMAFGDSHSDKVFLQEAGLGVAMGNAADVVKQVADAVTLSADNNGVAEVLALLLAD